MKKILCVIPALLGLAVLANPAQAQSDSGYHPFLSDTFQLSVGAFFPQQGFTLKADGTIPGEEINFEEALGISSSDTTAAVDFRWNFGEKWSVWGQWWKTNSSSTEVLTEDLVWDDIVFVEGTNATAGVDNSIVRLFFGRKLWSGPQYEFGVGLGLHWMSINAYIEGEIITEDDATGFQRGDVSVDAPLPDIGAWYYYSPAAKWLLSARVDWLSASVGDYDGSLWNVSAGVNYQFTNNFGIGLEYQFFELDVGVDSTDWNGRAKIKYNGPFVSLTANW